MYCTVKEIIREVLDTDVPDSECVFAVVLTRGDVRHIAQDWNLSDDELEMSVVAPAVYVGTWHKYNCGSIAGRWFDLATFDDERDFFAACRSLHQDEADPELMFQDYEGFPGNMASECHINWAYVEGFRQARDEGCEEAYRLWVDDTGETDFDTFRDAWWGEADSEEAFAVEFASDTGLLADVPETVALYFDYEAYARDLFLDSFTFIDGHVFRR